MVGIQHIMIILTVVPVICQAVALGGDCKGKTRKAPAVANVKVVCYPHVGCFDTRPPFGNAGGYLPMSPEKLQVQLRLHTRENKDKFQLLDYADASVARRSHFKATRPTKFVIHGFGNSADKSSWVGTLKDELLKKGDFNVIVVDWGKGAAFPDYDQAVANLRLVATEVMLLFDILIKQGLKLSDVHMIGHSLGAHMSGYIGLLRYGRIGRISGLDPAEPDFECLPTLVRLDVTDAKFVDVIHTNGAKFVSGGAGLYQQSGHVDFYVNGGKTQPGCTNGIYGAWEALKKGHLLSIKEHVACSHSRSHQLYIESINSHCVFTAFPCNNYTSFINGECFDCGRTGCSTMGYYADNYYGTGRMYLQTRASPPYCGYVYTIKVSIPSDGVETRGKLSVSLHGEWDNITLTPVTKSEDTTIRKGTTLTSTAVYGTEIGPIKAVTLKYEKYLCWWSFACGEDGKDSLQLSNIEVTAGDSGRRFSSCEGDFVVKEKTEKVFYSKDSVFC